MFNIIGADGKQYGPVAADQIRQWLREGRANGATQVQSVGSAEWQLIAAVAELAEAASASATPPNIPPQMTPPPNPGMSNRASNKLAAGLCGILLGGLGVHKFILGYNATGALMLGVTLSGFILGFLTCGVTFLAASAMSIVGLIEGIIYLTKPDEEFVRIYVDGRKEWF